MTQVSRKGFRDKNGKQVVIVPPKEEYAGEDNFQNSDAIDTILSEGVHHISYKKDGKKYPTQHILVVTRDYGKTGPIAPTREIVYQFLIDDLGGMMKRYRKFTDAELLEPDGEWTEWASMIPTIDIDSTITENGDNPVTGAAIYAALAGKMDAREFDSTPQPSSTKLLTSGTVYNALPKTIRIYLNNSEFHFETVNYLTQIIQGLVAEYDDREEDQDVDLINAIKVSFLDPYNVVFTAWGSLRITVSGTGTRTIGIYIYVDGYVFTSSATESSGTITVSTNALSVAENTFIADALDDESGS